MRSFPRSSIPLFLVIFVPASVAYGANPAAGTVVQWGCKTNTVAVAGRVLSNIVSVSAGISCVLALKNDGTVVGYGNNNVGQATGFPSSDPPYISAGFVTLGGNVLSNVIAVSAGGMSYAVKRDGTVVAWGDSRDGQLAVPAGLSNVTTVAVGWERSLALKSDGTVVAWGLGGGRPARVPASLSNVAAIAVAGPSLSRDLALRREGTVFEWVVGGIEEGPVTGLSNAVAVAAGEAHYLALLSDGAVFGWGANNVGQATGVATREPPYFSKGKVGLSGQVLSNIVAIAAAAQYSLGLKKDGTVVSWGDDWCHTTDVLGGLSNVVAIAPGLAITTNPAVAARLMQRR